MSLDFIINLSLFKEIFKNLLGLAKNMTDSEYIPLLLIGGTMLAVAVPVGIYLMIMVGEAIGYGRPKTNQISGIARDNSIAFMRELYIAADKIPNGKGVEIKGTVTKELERRLGPERTAELLTSIEHRTN